MHQLWGVPVNKIDTIWQDVEPLIQKVIDYQERHGGARAFLPDIKKGLKAQKYQMWAAHKDNIIEAVMITEIVQMPSRKVCSMFMVGGSGLNNWVHHLSTIEEWAKSLNCDSLELWGRTGWERLLKDFTKTMIVLEKGLK